MLVSSMTNNQAAASDDYLYLAASPNLPKTISEYYNVSAMICAAIGWKRPSYMRLGSPEGKFSNDEILKRLEDGYCDMIIIKKSDYGYFKGTLQEVYNNTEIIIVQWGFRCL